MLDHKAKFDKGNVQLEKDELSLHVSDSPDFNVSLKIVINNQSISSASLSLITKGKDIPESSLHVNYQEELSELLKYFDKYQASPEYLSKLSSIYKWLNEDKKAIELAQKASEISSDDIYKVMYGELLNELELTQEAESIFSSATMKNDIHSNLRMAYFKFQEKDLDETMGYLSKAVNLDPLNYSVRLFLGTIHLSTGNYDVAIRNFRVAQEEIYFSSVLHTNIALAYTMKGLYHKAHKQALIALKIEPMNFSALRILSDVSQELSFQETAVKHLKNYIESNPKNSRAYSLLARAYYSIGLKKLKNDKYYLSAFNLLRKEYKLAPSINALNNLGLISWKLKNFDVAYNALSQSIEQAVKLNTVFSCPLYNLVGMLISQKKYKEALRFLESFVDQAIENDDKLYQDLRLQKIVCLEALQQSDDSNNEVVKLLNCEVRDDIRCDLLVKAIYHYSVIEHNKPLALKYIELAEKWNAKNLDVDDSLKNQLINNLTFALVSYDELEQAKKFFPLISNITEQPFPCATLGMYHLRKGEIERGESYYLKAISMLVAKKDKDRFKLKLNYEKALQYFKSENFDKALRVLDKSQKYIYVADWISKDATSLNGKVKAKLLAK